jgi:hypothetical protein
LNYLGAFCDLFEWLFGTVIGFDDYLGGEKVKLDWVAGIFNLSCNNVFFFSVYRLKFPSVGDSDDFIDAVLLDHQYVRIYDDDVAYNALRLKYYDYISTVKSWAVHHV